MRISTLIGYRERERVTKFLNEGSKDPWVQALFIILLYTVLYTQLIEKILEDYSCENRVKEIICAMPEIIFWTKSVEKSMLMLLMIMILDQAFLLTKLNEYSILESYCIPWLLQEKSSH